MNSKLEGVKKNVALSLKLNIEVPYNNIKNVFSHKILKPSQNLVRKVVTGDEKKRVRDLIKEKKDKPQYIKLFDKISFTFFLMNIPICQYFLFNKPTYFWIWFIFIIPILLITRYFYFCSINMKYFLYDFCYFSNLLSLICIFWTPQWLFRMIFIYVNGPVTLAILVWRLSLVFHDFDRVTSIYIHLLPAVLFFVLRWHVIPSENIQPLSFYDLLNACIGYIFWQTCYYVKTEILDREILDNNPELMTSLRWLAADKKNATARGVLKLLRLLRIMKPEEDYVSTEFKTKFIFMSSQFFYTLLTFLPSFIVYYSYNLHMTYIILVFTNSVYNGASFYIEIFSKRYQLQFEKKEDMKKVIQAAAEIAIHAAAAAVADENGNNSSQLQLQSQSIPNSIPTPSNFSSSSTMTTTISPTSSLNSSTSGTISINPSPVELTLENLNSNEACLLKRKESNRLESEFIEENVNEQINGSTLQNNGDHIRQAIKFATDTFVNEWAAASKVSPDSQHYLPDDDEGRSSTDGQEDYRSSIDLNEYHEHEHEEEEEEEEEEEGIEEIGVEVEENIKNEEEDFVNNQERSEEIIDNGNTLRRRQISRNIDENEH